MIRFVLLALGATAWLNGASVRGTVLENQTGRALARAIVSLQPVPGTPGLPKITRTNPTGLFEFKDVLPGAYTLKASKRGFIPGEFGQKRWNSAGIPVVVAPEAAPFLSVRLLRYGAITGATLDGNDVGLPQQDIVAYLNTQPPRLVGRATSDDRGVYRIGGLEPGQYLVRSAGYVDDDVQYLPTFAPQSSGVEQSRPVDVYVDADSRDVDVRPVWGKLLTLNGGAQPGPAEITLASDMGRQTTVGGGFSFKSLPPARYELYAEIKGPPFLAAYMSLFLGGDAVQALALQPVRETRFEISPETTDAQVLARRKDYAGFYDAQVLKLSNNRALLGPGRWEFQLIPPSGQYVSHFSGPSMGRQEGSRPDSWNEVSLGITGNSIRFVLSSGGAVVQGTIKTLGELAIGAPVYLEAYDPNTGRRVAELRETRTDLRGSYRFSDVVPGFYRVLATFEYSNPDSGTMNIAGPRIVRLDAQSTSQVDLELFVIR